MPSFEQIIERLEWVEVTSSNIDAVAYDSQKLYIRFKNGAIYQYDPILHSEQTLDDYLDLLDAPSAGKFLHSVIIPHYKGVRLS